MIEKASKENKKDFLGICWQDIRALFHKVVKVQLMYIQYKQKVRSVTRDKALRNNYLQGVSNLGTRLMFKLLKV